MTAPTATWTFEESGWLPEDVSNAVYAVLEAADDPLPVVAVGARIREAFDVGVPLSAATRALRDLVAADLVTRCRIRRPDPSKGTRPAYQIRETD